MNTGPSSPSLFSQLVHSAKSSIHHIIHPHENDSSSNNNTNNNNTSKDNTHPVPDPSLDSIDQDHSSRLAEQQSHLEELKQRQREQLQHQQQTHQKGYDGVTVPLESLTIEHDDGQNKYQLSVPVSSGNEDSPRFHLDGEEDQNEKLKLHPSFPNDPTVPAPGEMTYPRLRGSSSSNNSGIGGTSSTVHSPSSASSRATAHTSWTTESTPSSPQYSVYSSAANSVGATPATGMSPRTMRKGSFMFPSGQNSGGGENENQYLTPAQRRRMSMGDVDQYQRKQNRIRNYPQTIGPSKTNLNQQQIIDENESEEQQQQQPQLPLSQQSQQQSQSNINSPSGEFRYPTFHYEANEESPHPYYTPQANRARRLTAPSISSSASSFSSSQPVPSPVGTSTSAASASVPPPHPSASVYRRASAAGLLSPNSSSESTETGTSDSNHHGVPKTAALSNGNGVGTIMNGGSGLFSANPPPPRPDFLNLGDPREPMNQALPASHPQAARLNAWLLENGRLQAQAYAQDQDAMTRHWIK